MSRMQVIAALLKQPRELITAGYAEIVKKQKSPDYKGMALAKHGRAQLPTIDLLDLCPDLQDTLECYSFMPDTSMITDILLLRALAKRYNQCAYLEIGSYRGESVVAISGITGDCTCITLSGDEMLTMGYSPDAIDVQGVFYRSRPDIKAYLHNSLTFDFGSLNKKFDLIFVDGDHSYNAVATDTKNVFKVLNDETSVIVWHDYSFDPENVRHEVLAAILDGTPPEYHNNLYHVSNTMCAVFIRGDFKTRMTHRHEFPNKIFKVDVQAKPFSPER